MIRTIFNGLNHYKVSADFNSYRLNPFAPHRVRFAPQNRLLEPADCMWAEPTKKGLQMPLFVLQKILKFMYNMSQMGNTINR